jgi:hypothetical protein
MGGVKRAYRIAVCMTTRQGPWLIEQLIADRASRKVSYGDKVDFQESSELLRKVNTGL